MTDKSLLGLQALPLKFPKQCNCCGRVFHTQTEFLEQTSGMQGGRSCLQEGEQEDGQVVLRVFRNCLCGSTLMDEFQSRRDNSAAGQKRREDYAKAHLNTGQHVAHHKKPF